MYYVDSIQQDTLHLIRGQKYIFDGSGATSHPIRLSTDSANTTSYTSGYTTGSNNTHTFVVPYDSPDDLYYYCASHSNMGGAITVRDLTANDLQGIQGTKGSQGLQGNQGTQGVQNAQGNQGVQGAQGLQGAQGVQNTQGTQGVQGAQGLQGAQGTQGTQGVQGAQGLNGLSSANVNIDDIVSVSSGEISADDAGADKIVFWDDSEDKLTYLTVGTNLSISETTISTIDTPTFTSAVVGSGVTINADGINVTGIVTATTFDGNFSGNVTGIASTATKLETSRNFSISGDFVTAPSIGFDGTDNVSFAATITTNSITLGTYTTGDYVESITGTGNQITVTSGTGEGSTPVISIPNNPTLPGTTVTVATDLQVNRNLNVDGNITIGGTSATLFTETLRISDPDIILGFRTDANGNDVSNDTTANHGGVAVASTEGSPIVSLIGAGETLPVTYKKIMWFQSGAFTGLATDSWLTNYAFGVGTTSMSAGTKFAVGNIETDFDDITSVRHIYSSGIVTATDFVGNLTGTASTASGATGDFSIADKIVHTGDTNTAIRFPAADTFAVETAGSERLRITSIGLVGIGTEIPSEKLDVNGNVKAIDFNATSDQNLKDNIRTIEDPLAKVVQIRGVNFDWKETQKPSVGVIAQEVEKVFPELVTDSGTKTVNYNGLIGLLIEVVKEQQTQINSLNERLSKLE